MMFTIRRDRNEWFAGDGVVAQGREGWTMEELLVTVLNLLDSKLVVIRSYRYVPAINDLEPRKERVNL